MLYDVTTHPEGQIRGSRGVSGRTPEKTFYIQVTPETKYIYLNLKKSGEVQSERFGLQGSIKKLRRLMAAESSTPTWQKAFRSSESKLAERAAADKSPPTIVVTSPTPKAREENVRVDTYQAYVRGRVTDNEGVMTVLVNGQKAGVKADGSFAAKLKLAFGANRISVQAEDIHGNVAEKAFTIIREEYIPEQSLADVDMPPPTKMKKKNGLAVVIGVENYQYVSDASYAYNDAEVFREYLSETLGFSKSKVKIATNSRASLAEFNKLLGPDGWLSRNVVPGKSDIVVYFSGHGIPDPKTKETGLLPFDVDPNYSVGLSLTKLYTTLGNLQARSVTIFLDACFTGENREKAMLLADARPILIVPNEAETPPGVTVLSAASVGQISSAAKDKEHGLFTYYVLKGMGGEADNNDDQKLTIGELGSYVRSKVKERAAMMGREQTPELVGERDRVLVRY